VSHSAPRVSEAAPRVTVSLVTWNGRAWLPGCLDSIAAQTLADHELLILDNGSTDGSADWLRRRAPSDARIRLQLLDHNLGYAAGHDRNIAVARGAGPSPRSRRRPRRRHRLDGTRHAA